MLSVISPDGYALTGAHVLKEDEDSCILASSSENKRLHVCELRLTTKGKTKTIHFLQAYPQKSLGMGEIRGKTVSTKKIRVVHIFPGRDLALIKLSQKGKNYFKLGERPSPGDLLYSSGNSQASQPGASSGVVKKITTRNLIHATLPLAPGDSGGPVMDSSGALVGIAVQGRLGDLKTLRFMNHSGIELIPKEELIALIRRDRTLFPGK
ncbi:MAG: serine protease [Verrucomicrobiales bacterium]